jgi:site-specific recombinase XerD
MEISETTASFKQYLMRRYGDRSTPKHYLSDLHVFSLHLGAMPIVEATKADIESFVDEQRKRGLAPTTINRRLATLHTFFEYIRQDKAPMMPGPIPSIGGSIGSRKATLCLETLVRRRCRAAF